MASTLTIPHFINYAGAISGAIPRPIPGTIPPVTAVPMNPQFPQGSIPVTSTNGGAENYGNIIPTLQVPVIPVGGGCYNDGMEVVWHGEFSRLFSNFYPPHVWYLTITNQAPQHKWKFHRDSAKVRFCCQDCGNGWTSMKGRVTFWFYLDYDNNSGFVQFKLYGQQCKKCNSGKFEYVMWYPEEVSKVMCNVYNKVGQTYYGFLQPPIRIDRRPGRPRNQHNADLCQACRDGECDQARPIKPLFNSNPLVHTALSVPAPPITSASSQTVEVSYSSQTQNSTNPPKLESFATEVPSSIQSSDNILNNEVASKPSTNNQSSNIASITTPITPGVRPILTYSVMGAPPKSASLNVTSNQFIPRTVPRPPVNHYIYHPNPMMNGTIPFHPPTVYPILPPKSVIKSGNKPLTQANNVTTITNSMESVKITATSDSKKIDQTKENSKAEETNVDKEQTNKNPLPKGVTSETG